MLYDFGSGKVKMEMDRNLIKMDQLLEMLCGLFSFQELFDFWLKKSPSVLILVLGGQTHQNHRDIYPLIACLLNCFGYRCSRSHGCYKASTCVDSSDVGRKLARC